MAKTAARDLRRGLPGTMTVARPYSREEADFVKALANKLNHATAEIAADPDKPFPAGSVGERIRNAYLPFRPNQRPAIQQRARDRLAASATQRRRYFGAYADRGAGERYHTEPGLGPELRAQLRQAVRARLNAQRREITESLSIGVAVEFVGGASYLTPKTTLEMGYFTGDVQASWKDLTITAPSSIQLKWGTNATAVERGVWQIFRSLQSGQLEVPLGSGIAGVAPGGVFSINLGNYLPASPPAAPAVYRIRVTPGTEPKIDWPDEGGVIQIPGKAVGPPSNDVVITYSSTLTPPLKLDIFEVYYHAWFLLESIYMVQDQNGPGTEEFHVAGFVQESLPTSSDFGGAQSKFGPLYAELNPDGPRSKDLSQSELFGMNKPSDPEWPRSFATVISVLEEDDGGSLSDWQSSVWTVAEEMVSGEIGQAVRDDLEENFKQYIGDNLGQIIQTGGQLAQAIASLIGSTVSAIIGMVVAVAALVISDIISGMADDYYGTEAFVLVLPTNITDWVHTNPGEAIPGGYRFETQVLEFRGHPSYPDAAQFDGVVDVFFHWEFGGKGYG